MRQMINPYWSDLFFNDTDIEDAFDQASSSDEEVGAPEETVLAAARKFIKLNDECEYSPEQLVADFNARI